MTPAAVCGAPPGHPKVSVCVITYNQEGYIRDCLQSLVMQQTDFDFEVIVGDDCSTDGTRAVIDEFVKRYPNLVRPIYQPKNTGGSRNNLEVHAAARGDYVAHVDGDDYVLPGKLQAQSDLLDLEITCNAVWHRVDYFDDEGRFCSGNTADLSSFKNGRVTFGDAIQLGFIGVYSSLMYRRSARSPIDLSRKVLDLHLTWDLLASGHGYVIDAVFGRYRIASSGSLTVSSLKAVRLLAIEHADEYLRRYPLHRRDFMVWALCNAIVDAKNLRTTVLKFLGLAWRARSPLRLAILASNLRRVRRIQVQWRHQRQMPPRRSGTEKS